MSKIQMNPIAELDGDEMTRILWKQIKEIVLEPFVELNTEYYDLGLPERDRTDDAVTLEAAKAIKRLGVGVKCATITPNAGRMTEYNLHRMYPSPNGTLRAYLDGTVFRCPITVPGLKNYVPGWVRPITVARHAYGDVYKAVDLHTEEPGEAVLVFRGESGKEQTVSVQKVNGPAVWQGQHNLDSSIRDFAHACFRYAIDMKQDLWFSAKDTIAKVYDGVFRDVFEEVYADYKEQFEALGLTYFYTLIDDAVARVIRSEGGYIWACKNYDGDVMSDMVSTAFGSLAMMTSVLVTPDGKYEYEAAHGTVTRHYYRYLKGERTSTNCINWGIVPFTMDEDFSLTECASGDWLYVPGLREGILAGREAFPARLVGADGTRELTVYCKGLTEEERLILTEGCLMNYYAAGYGAD